MTHEELHAVSRGLPGACGRGRKEAKLFALMSYNSPVLRLHAALPLEWI